ncbi:hypothetical protein V5799_020901 [Amblyomma americanum]|uniref:Uncharacterized protein n=1 Tax=Amblyomma americanum TaxID=6943 RepID=A0AAQ4ESQ5_AMBAM
MEHSKEPPSTLAGGDGIQRRSHLKRGRRHVRNCGLRWLPLNSTVYAERRWRGSPACEAKRLEELVTWRPCLASTSPRSTGQRSAAASAEPSRPHRALPTQKSMRPSLRAASALWLRIAALARSVTPVCSWSSAGRSSHPVPPETGIMLLTRGQGPGRSR